MKGVEHTIQNREDRLPNALDSFTIDAAMFFVFNKCQTRALNLLPPIDL